jgi:hypothetical protein
MSPDQSSPCRRTGLQQHNTVTGAAGQSRAVETGSIVVSNESHTEWQTSCDGAVWCHAYLLTDCPPRLVSRHLLNVCKHSVAPRFNNRKSLCLTSCGAGPSRAAVQVVERRCRATGQGLGLVGQAVLHPALVATHRVPAGCGQQQQQQQRRQPRIVLSGWRKPTLKCQAQLEDTTS